MFYLPEYRYSYIYRLTIQYNTYLLIHTFMCVYVTNENTCVHQLVCTAPRTIVVHCTVKVAFSRRSRLLLPT